MIVADKIEQKLNVEFSPIRLDITDDSAAHAGHSGARPGGQTHFNVLIVAAAFEKKSRVERQRMVFGALKDEMEENIHALSLKIFTPAEYDK